jgi:hypothetical protein
LQWLIATKNKIKLKKKRKERELEKHPLKLLEVTIGKLLRLFLTTVAFFYPGYH